MVTKKPTDNSSDNFRQQDSSTRKLNKEVGTAAQKQNKQTANVIDDEMNSKSQGQKKSLNQTNQPVNESQQQETTGSKLNKPIGTTEQQFSNSTNDNSQQRNDDTQKKNQGNLRKQFSNEATDDFRQHESTTNKINSPIETAEQQQFNQTTSALNDPNDSSGSKLQKSSMGGQHFSQDDLFKVASSFTPTKSTNESKRNKNFRQQESTASKVNKPMVTSEQQQHSQTSKVTSKSNVPKGKLGKSKSGVARNRLKLVTSEVGRGTLKASKNGLKNSAHKYRTELEQGDDAVKVSSQGTLVANRTVKVSAKLVLDRRKNLKAKKLQSQKFIKGKINPLYKEKTESRFKKVSKTPALVLKKTSKKIINAPGLTLKTTVVKGAKSYKGQLEQGDDGVKLVSQGTTQIARASNKLAKGISKIGGESGKLGRRKSKLTQNGFNKGKSLKVKSKAALKKKAIRKRMYAPQRGKSRVAASVMASFSNRIKVMIKGLGKINLKSIGNAIGMKVAAWAGAGLITIMPYLLAVAVGIIILAAIVGGGGDQESQPQIGGALNLSPEVEQWRGLVETEAAAEGMEAYVGLILALIQVESRGVGTRDIMQSSESAGYPRNYWQTEELSVRQGVKYLKSIVNTLKGFGAGFENNAKLIAQAYNFGSAFAGYVGRQGGEYSLDVAEQYSRTVVAPSLGNHAGTMYSYVNAISTSLGKPYLYRNGGNFMYGDLVGQYISQYAEGELAPPAQPLRVTSGFGNRDSPGGVGSTDHRGLDFGCREYVTPILTVLDGTVYRSGVIGGLGNALVIKHNDNFYSTYGHMSSLNVGVGDTVRAGQQIGICGNTGTSTAPHLHFEIAPDASFRNQIDPYPYFQHLLGG